MDNVLIILRGAPGSGKSTFANLITNNVCEADKYHYVDGVYMWRVDKLKRAHHKCKLDVKSHMELNHSPIVVSNTSISEREIKPYYELANEFGYTVISAIVENRHGGESIHNVPMEKVNKMKERLISNIKL